MAIPCKIVSLVEGLFEALADIAEPVMIQVPLGETDDP